MRGGEDVWPVCSLEVGVPTSFVLSEMLWHCLCLTTLCKSLTPLANPWHQWCIWNRLLVTNSYSRPCNKIKIMFKEMPINLQCTDYLEWQVQRRIYQFLFLGQSYNQMILVQINSQNTEYFDPTISGRSKILHMNHCTLSRPEHDANVVVSIHVILFQVPGYSILNRDPFAPDVWRWLLLSELFKRCFLIGLRQNCSQFPRNIYSSPIFGK